MQTNDNVQMNQNNYHNGPHKTIKNIYMKLQTKTTNYTQKIPKMAEHLD